MDYALMTHRSTATANNGDVGSRADAADTTTANIITTIIITTTAVSLSLL